MFYFILNLNFFNFSPQQVKHLSINSFVFSTYGPLSSGIIILLYPSLTSSASQKAFTCPITVLIPCRQLIQPDKHKNGVQQKHKRSKINLTPWLLLHY